MIKPLSLEDVLAMPEERREFIDGELYMPPAPEPDHQNALGNLHTDVKVYLRQNPIGRVFFAPLDVLFGGKLSQPDLIFVGNARAEIITDKLIDGAPDWLVEVVSPTSRKRDFETKKALYLDNGVKEYWVIAQDGQVVWVFTPDNLEGEVYGKGDLEPSLLPGLKINIPSLFRS
jgi:Uma2 family endonuclease